MLEINARGKDASIVAMGGSKVEEFYRVALPEDTDGAVELARIKGGGFKVEYRFRRDVVDRRSRTLAKAQAASIASRIKAKTGVEMEVSHIIVVTS